MTVGSDQPGADPCGSAAADSATFSDLPAVSTLGEEPAWRSRLEPGETVLFVDDEKPVLRIQKVMVVQRSASTTRQIEHAEFGRPLPGSSRRSVWVDCRLDAVVATEQRLLLVSERAKDSRRDPALMRLAGVEVLREVLIGVDAVKARTAQIRADAEAAEQARRRPEERSGSGSGLGAKATGFLRRGALGAAAPLQRRAFAFVYDSVPFLRGVEKKQHRVQPAVGRGWTIVRSLMIAPVFVPLFGFFYLLFLYGPLNLVLKLFRLSSWTGIAFRAGLGTGGSTGRGTTGSYELQLSSPELTEELFAILEPRAAAIAALPRPGVSSPTAE